MPTQWVPEARQLARLGERRELSRAARVRLDWLDWHRRHGGNVARTCRHFGISRQTFYRWHRRLQGGELAQLEDRSHRPRRCRQPTWLPRQAGAVLALRRQYPPWGKDKLAVLLARQGRALSVSMVGRILAQAKRQRRLTEPIRQGVSPSRRHPRPRPWAVRKPKAYQPARPGDLAEVDTLDLRPLPGLVLKQFTARGVVSRWDVLEVRSRATSTTAAQFLTTLQARMPFPTRALQVDGGSELAAEFEQGCQSLGLPLYVLPPRSPKLNGHAERADRAHTEEFHEITPTDWHLPALNRDLRRWSAPKIPSALIRRSAIAPRCLSRKEPNCNSSTGRVQGVD
ncbi:MAG: helix-turn-helix domain-containing protein [Terriglobales bacterium]